MTFQVGAALLDACVLAGLQKEDAYGYILTQNVKDVINVSESTLYPVLRRLQQDDCLTAYDMPFQGRNRRYYRITQSGRDKLREYRGAWRDFTRTVGRVLWPEGGEGVDEASVS